MGTSGQETVIPRCHLPREGWPRTVSVQHLCVWLFGAESDFLSYASGYRSQLLTCNKIWFLPLFKKKFHCNVCEWKIGTGWLLPCVPSIFHMIQSEIVFNFHVNILYSRHCLDIISCGLFQYISAKFPQSMISFILSLLFIISDLYSHKSSVSFPLIPENLRNWWLQNFVFVGSY